MSRSAEVGVAGGRGDEVLDFARLHLVSLKQQDVRSLGNFRKAVEVRVKPAKTADASRYAKNDSSLP